MQINTSIETGVGGRVDIEIDVETSPNYEGDTLTATTLGVATSEGHTLTETTTEE